MNTQQNWQTLNAEQFSMQNSLLTVHEIKQERKNQPDQQSKLQKVQNYNRRAQKLC